MYIVGALLFTASGQGIDPLMWRSFSSSDSLMYWMHEHFYFLGWGAQFSNHHFLDLAAEGGMCVALASFFSRSQKTDLLKWGLLATYGGVLAWGVHEGIWWLVYVWLWAPKNLVILSGWGELIVFTLLVMTPALGLYAPKRFIVWMLGFYVIWVAFGFPITESFLGNTPLYGVWWANAWEVGSWMWATVGFYWLERDGLLAWFERVRWTALNPGRFRKSLPEIDRPLAVG